MVTPLGDLRQQCETLKTAFVTHVQAPCAIVGDDCLGAWHFMQIRLPRLRD